VCATVGAEDTQSPGSFRQLNSGYSCENICPFLKDSHLTEIPEVQRKGPSLGGMSKFIQHDDFPTDEKEDSD